MKIQRKLAGFSACALVLSSLTVPVAHAAKVDFDDINSHWAKSSIERWAGYEVVNGMGNNQFKPEDTMTRAQMAQILSKTLGLTATTTNNPFTDVKDTDWFKDAILKCNAAGIINGTSATTANPNAPISRQDAVTMMGRALGIEADGDSTTFDDNDSIGAWAAGFVNAMAKRGIVNGRSEGMFAPKGDIKRGEIATILDRAITTYVDTPNTEIIATGKGITLIAAPGVTVKGEAEDILVAPAATGTTILDSVKVSGVITMQAANGTLVLGDSTTVAKLTIPALATGAKITVEKDATVAAMISYADNVTVDGTGTITAMTVESGKGVTVAGTVKVGKITNNSQDSMKYGNNIIAGVGGTTPSTGGGGGSSGGHGGGSQRVETSNLTVAFAPNTPTGKVTVKQGTADVNGTDGVYAVSKDTDATINVAFDAEMSNVTYAVGNDTEKAKLTTTDDKTTAEIVVAKDKLASDVTVTVSAALKQDNGDQTDNSVYTITFDVNATALGIGVTPPEKPTDIKGTKAEIMAMTEPKLTVSGFTFQYWAFDGGTKFDFKEPNFIRAEKVAGTDNEWKLTLTAAWLRNATDTTQDCTVTFMNGETEVKKVSVKYGEKIKTEDKPTDPPASSGKKFDGWYLGDTKVGFEDWTVTADFTLTAKWIDVHGITVTAAEADATVAVMIDGKAATSADMASVEAGAKVQLTATPAAGKSVTLASNDATLTDVTSDATLDGGVKIYEFTMPSKNVTVTATAKDTTYTVNYQLVKGSDDTSSTVKITSTPAGDIGTDTTITQDGKLENVAANTKLTITMTPPTNPSGGNLDAAAYMLVVDLRNDKDLTVTKAPVKDMSGNTWTAEVTVKGNGSLVITVNTSKSVELAQSAFNTLVGDTTTATGVTSTVTNPVTVDNWTKLITAAHYYDMAQKYVDANTTDTTSKSAVEALKAAYEKVTELKITTNTSTFTISTSPLQYFTKLGKLDLSNPDNNGKAQGVGITELGGLEKLTELTELNISGNKNLATNVGSSGNAVVDISALAGMTKLTKLNISDTNVNNIGALASLTTITDLNMSGTNITDLGALANLTALQTLDVSGCSALSDVNSVQKLTNLKELDISDTAVNNFGWLLSGNTMALTNLTKLTAKNLTPVAGAINALRIAVTQVLSGQATTLSDFGKQLSIDLTDLTATNLTSKTANADGDEAHLEQIKQAYTGHTSSTFTVPDNLTFTSATPASEE